MADGSAQVSDSEGKYVTRSLPRQKLSQSYSREMQSVPPDLCGATGLAAFLLLYGAMEELASEPRLSQQSRPDRSVWNAAFSSESRRVSSTTLPVSRKRPTQLICASS